MSHPPLRKRTRRAPWQRDPNDREANYRRPIPQHEKVRLTIKGAAAVAGFLFVMSATRDRHDVGAELLIGVGAPLVVAGYIDLIATLEGRLDHIFIDSRPLQIASHIGVALAGAVMVVVGFLARASS